MESPGHSKENQHKIPKNGHLATENSASSPGDRLKQIRQLLRLTRPYIQKHYRLRDPTLKSWENGLLPLTAANAERCIQIFLSEGMVVSVDWILNGVGFPPILQQQLSHTFSWSATHLANDKNETLCMLRDADMFKQQYPDAITFFISTNDMRPFYRPGDYIG